MAAKSGKARKHRKDQNREYQRRWRANNPDKVRAHNKGGWAKRNKDVHANARLIRVYGITLAQYNAMCTLQGGVCAICERPPKKLRLHVDHDHHDGRVRGLLCYYCNRRVVGRLTLENARKVVAYLEKDFDGRQIKA